MFEAEVITETKVQDPTMSEAVKVVNGCFTWDSPPPEAGRKKKGSRGKKGKATKDVSEKGEQEKKEVIFGLKDVNLEIPKGRLTAIVGSCKFATSRLLAHAKTLPCRTCRLW